MLAIQVAFSAIVMASYTFVSAPSTFNLQKMLSWAPCAFLFTSNIVTSAMALEYITVPAFSVLLNVQPFISTCFSLCDDRVHIIQPPHARSCRHQQRHGGVTSSASVDAVGPMQSTPHGGTDAWQQLTTCDGKLYYLNTHTGHGQ